MTLMDYHSKYMELIGGALLELDEKEAACFMAMIRQTSTESLQHIARSTGTPMELMDRLANSYAGMLAKAVNDLGLEL